ncbi:MAG TPA: hypothetical protein VFB59_06025 [Candidatus Saccharimonadales bacterium]|nr:hypothetical protein [Candidatus Saccharimonadales bacterium]
MIETLYRPTQVPAQAVELQTVVVEMPVSAATARALGRVVEEETRMILNPDADRNGPEAAFQSK